MNKRYSMESQSRYFSCSDFFDGNLEFSRDDVIRSSLSSRNGKRNGPKEMILINVVLQRELFPILPTYGMTHIRSKITESDPLNLV